MNVWRKHLSIQLMAPNTSVRQAPRLVLEVPRGPRLAFKDTKGLLGN